MLENCFAVTLTGNAVDQLAESPDNRGLNRSWTVKSPSAVKLKHENLPVGDLLRTARHRANRRAFVQAEIADTMEPKRRVSRQRDGEFEFAADRLDVASQRRQVHIGLLLDLGDGGLLDLQRRRHVLLSLAGDLAQRAQA